jgi:integrase/recombinase XerD
MVRKRKRRLDILSRDEVQSLIGRCSRRAPTGRRNAALLALLYGAGLRIGEALDLLPADLDLERRRVTVQHGKGGKRRTVMILSGMAELEAWLERRKALGFNGRHPVFLTLDGNPLQSRYVRTLVARLAERVGIEKRVHPHGLRHAHAVELERRGHSIGAIMRQLGHTRPSVTDIYLEGLGADRHLEELAGEDWDQPPEGASA